MYKKLLSLVLAVSIIFPTAMFKVSAATEEYTDTSSGITYTLDNSNNQATVKGPVDKATITTANILATIAKDGTEYTVTSIKDNAFDDCSSLTTITIPKDVTSIGSSAFRGCAALTSVNIPNGVENIERFTFQGCSSLALVTIPKSAKNIGGLAFNGCTSLTTIEIPESVESIGGSAFSGCKRLTKIITPCNFDNSKITGITINYSDKTRYTVESTIPGTIGTFEYVHNPSDGICTRCGEVDGLRYALNSDGSTAKVIDLMDNNIEIVNIPETITIGEKKYTVTGIGNMAFQNCTRLTTIEIPDGVTSIGDRAFYACRGLTSVTIPDGVTSIGDRAFNGCSGLTSVTIPKSVTNMGVYAFQNCSGLTSVTIPESVTNMGNSAFSGCSKLTTITIPCNFDKSKINGITINSNKTGYTVDNTNPRTAGTFEYTHDYAEATCTKPKTCQREGCNATEGEALGHKFAEATCTKPKTCTVCGETDGEALGHKFAEATCTKPKTCQREGCNATEGEALGHDFAEATCTKPKTCTVCGETDGKALGHNFEGTTCTTDGTCTRCGAIEKAPGHKFKAATCTKPKTCTVCGETEGEPLGHDYKETKIAPTADTIGAILHTCTGCGDKYYTDLELKIGSTPTKMPDGTPINNDSGVVKAESFVELEGEQIKMIIQDPLGVLTTDSNDVLGLEVQPVEKDTARYEELMEDLDETHDVENIRFVEINPTVNGVAKTGELNGKIRVLCKIPEGWGRERLEVVLIKAGVDGEFDEKIETINGKDYIAIYTDHFSPYAIIKTASQDDNQENNQENNANNNVNGGGSDSEKEDQQSNAKAVSTGDNAANAGALALISMSALACACYIVYTKKKAND